MTAEQRTGWAVQVLAWAAAIAGLGLAGVFVWPEILTSTAGLEAVEAISAQNDTRRTVAQAGLAIAAVVGGYLTWRRVVASDRQVLIAEFGLTVDRYVRAIDQLGSGSQAVRAAAIVSLRELALTVPDRFGQTIIDLFSSYVRNSIAADGPTLPPDGGEALQAAVTVATAMRDRGLDAHIELGGTHLLLPAEPKLVLARAQFHDVNFSGGDLTGAYLEEAAFWSCQLDDTVVYLLGNEIVYGTMNGARVVQALASRFKKVDLSDVDFSGAMLRMVSFEACSLDGAVFEGCEFTEVTFEDCTGDPIALPAEYRKFLSI